MLSLSHPTAPPSIAYFIHFSFWDETFGSITLADTQ